MKKRIKMLLYGEPGVGKSVFAVKAPKPFFICTDGNYEWLDEFGAKEEDHINVSSWDDAKKAFRMDFDNYETIVIDLLEDMFKWGEQEYCIKNRIEHVSDVAFGKAYDATRNEFFIEISKLLNLDKNVILICHGITFTTKDRRGVEHTRYAPSSRIPDKVLDMIEGRVRYCLRCYTAAEEQLDGTIVKKRFLSLVPKENEFGIIRGVDENAIPHDIPLDFNEFLKAIGSPEIVSNNTKKVETKAEPTVVEKPVETVEDTKAKIEALRAKKEAARVPVSDMPMMDTTPNKVNLEKKPEIKVMVPKYEQTEIKVSEDAPYTDPVPVETPAAQVVSGEDKLAAIKAKLAAMKAKKS